MGQSPSSGVIRFGAFAVEPQAGILRKGDVRIRLQEQPFQVLLALLQRPGEVVTREELHQKVWKDEAFGDLDHRLNIAVNKIREALRDSADAPRYVETLPRRGYRFVAPVDCPQAAKSEPLLPAPSPERLLRKQPWWIWASSVLAVLVAAAGLGAWLLWPDPPPELMVRRLTNDPLPKTAPVLSDGSRLYFRTYDGIDSYIVQVPLAGGEPSRLPLNLPSSTFALLDIAPDGQEILFRTTDQPCLSACEGHPLWAVRLADGSSRRLGNLVGWWGTYSPDGQRIAFMSGALTAQTTLSTALSDGSGHRQLLTLKGLEIFAPVWSPDGTQIAMGLRQRKSQEISVWTIQADGGEIQRMFPEWRPNHAPVGWTPDGRFFVAKSGRELWILPEPSRWSLARSLQTRLTLEEPEFLGPFYPRAGRILYAVGLSPLGELQRLDRRSKTWIQHLGGISADGVEYSRDGLRMAYINFPSADLWARFADGSRPVQLTKPPMLAFLPRWSPNGKTIAFMGRGGPKEPWRIHLVDPLGGTPRLACPANPGPEGDMSWAPDGKSLVYSPPTNQFYSGEKPYLRVLNLATCQVTQFPGSDGMWSPRWSPDGSTLAAGAEAKDAVGRPMMLYHVATGQWEEVMRPGFPNWPFWSHDGKSLWYWDLKTVVRYDLETRRHEEVVPLSGSELTGSHVASWFALTPNDEPMILRRRDIRQIYALEWKDR